MRIFAGREVIALSPANASETTVIDAITVMF
jgi:hypothetical protein